MHSRNTRDEHFDSDQNAAQQIGRQSTSPDQFGISTIEKHQDRAFDHERIGTE